MLVCVVVLVLKLPGRQEGARGPSEASAVLLAAGCCCRNELAHARIAPFFRSATAPNPLRCEKDLGRGSAPEAGHTNTRTRTRLASKLLVFAKPKVLFGVHWSFRVCLRHLGCGAGTGAPFRRTQESGSLILSPRARAPFSNHRQAAGNQPRLSRGFSMGPWPSRGSNGLRAGFVAISETLQVSPATFRHERTGGLFACFATFATLDSLPRLLDSAGEPASTLRELLHVLSCKELRISHCSLTGPRIQQFGHRIAQNQ